METVTILKRRRKIYLIVSVNEFMTVTDCISLNKVQRDLLRQAYRKAKSEADRALINVCLQSRLNQ